MRTEYCTCDFNECSVKANVEHNSIIPKDWSRSRGFYATE